MARIKELMREAAELPVEERAILIDSLLRTLNVPDPAVDRAWIEVARQRLSDLRAGQVRPVPGDEVFARLKDRFGR